MDISKHIRARSDQLNSEDLIGGPITVKIEDVSKGNSEQPVVIKISGGHQPFKPCKTTLRVLAATMGIDTRKWVGTYVTLFRDEHVKWAGVEVGGIRIKALSAIDQSVTLQLTETRGKKTAHKIEPLKPPTDQQQSAPPSESVREKPVTPGEVAEIEKLLMDIAEGDEQHRDEMRSKLLERHQIESLDQLDPAKVDGIIRGLEKKAGR